MPERRVTKREAEDLIGAIEVGDTPGLAGVVAVVLARLTGGEPGNWHRLVADAGSIGGWSAERIAAVDRGDHDALEQLAIDLSELRSLLVDA